MERILMLPATHIPRLSQRQAGVTLLELLLVIAVMAIILAVSMPAFTSMGRGAGLRGAVAEVKSTISLARQWAITKRERVTFDSGHDAAAANAPYYAVRLADPPYTIVQATNYLEKGHGFQQSDTFTFKSSGDVEGPITPDRTITITNLNGNAKTITVVPMTGVIRVE